LFSREGPPREFGRGASHGLQFVGLHLVSDRDILPAIGLDTLLQPGVIMRSESWQKSPSISSSAAVWAWFG
jgi:hypothetical protein